MNNILIVIDAQNDFISGVLGNPACKPVVEYIAKKVKKYHDKGVQVIFTRDTHYDNYFNTLEGKKLPMYHCKKDSWGWNLDPRIDNTSEDIYVDKETFGYLHWPSLLDPLKVNEDTVIELVGFDTDICVISNGLILRAAYSNNRIFVDAKGCWGTTKEKHNAALDTMESCQIEVYNRN